MTLAAREGAATAEPGYRLLIDLQAARAVPNTWEVADNREVVCVEASRLACLLEKGAAADPITRICAANWLSEIDPVRCGEALAQLNPSWQGRERQLQLTCLQLLSMRPHRSGQEASALRLLRDPEAPSECRKWAAVYLGVRHYEPALEHLEWAARNAADEVGIGAICGLGAYGGPQAATALLAVLKKPPQGDKVIARLVAENLALTKARSPDIFDELWRQVREKNDAALYALLASRYPRTLRCFRAWASKEKAPDFKGWIARGLLASGGAEALPDVLEMLKKDDSDDPPPGDDLTAENDLVRELQGWMSSHKSVPFELLVLARSNCRAAQVLAGSNQQLAELAFTNTDVAQVAFIALYALATRWSAHPENVPHFRMALDKWRNQPDILVTAIHGLGNSGSQEVVGDLNKFRNDTNENVRKAAELALAKLAKLKKEKNSAP